MMNKLKYLAFVFAALFVVSCDNDEPLPFDEFDDLGYGAYARRLAGPTGTYDGSFNFFDVPNSDVSFTVEFVDESNGANVDSYSWTVAYEGVGPVDIFAVSKSAFTTSEFGLPGTSFTFTFQETLDALGLTIDDVEGGKFFDFQATVTKADGSQFTSANTGSNIISSASFAGLFQYRANIICPSNLEGTFDAVTMSSGTFGAAATWEGTVIWENEGNGVYQIYTIGPSGEQWIDASMGGYYAGWGTADQPGLPLGDLRFVDACEVMSITGADRFSDPWSFTSMESNGAVLNLVYETAYGEIGTVSLTRTDGTEWPADLRL